MKKLFAAFFVLILAALACATQPGTPAPQANVETVVAQTMDALTANVPAAPETTATPLPGPSGLLPRSLYFLNTDDAGFSQVYRMETDGSTVTQITFEPATVDQFDVSPVDGSVAYISNNQLLLINVDGSNRRMLADGGPIEQNTPYLARVTSPAWSPNGQTIAYHHNGLNFYGVQSAANNLVMEDLLDEAGGTTFPRELYFPTAYSPDGSKLLLSVGHLEGGTYAIFQAGANVLSRSDPALLSCCSEAWAPDSSAVFAASDVSGMITPGMWRINSDGTTTTLLGGSSATTPEFAFAPKLSADGQLYFFYNAQSDTGFVDHMPLYMVRSAPDGVTGRTNLSDTLFDNLNEVLWAPDASFALIAVAPSKDVVFGGAVQLVYTDGQPTVSLLPFGSNLHWGP